MKKLLILLAALIIPTAVFAGNMAPQLYLELYQYADDPEDPGPLPPEVCVHPQPTEYPWTLPCYAPWVRYNYYVVPVHIGSLDTPTCTTTGPACADFGGYLGLPFGVASTGTGTLSFMSATACAGFLKGPSNAGEPAAILISSTALCHPWLDHCGFLKYFASSSATGAARHLNIVANADLGYVKVVNCANLYDDGTAIAGGVQVGGTQDIVCGTSPTPVNTTTWGAIKGLYR